MQNRPIARIFYQGHIEAYRVTDGIKVMDLTPVDFYSAVKQGAIENCKASGGSITGINGFELKKLETINRKSKIQVMATLVLAGQFTVGYILRCADPQDTVFGSYTYNINDMFMASIANISQLRESIVDFEVKPVDSRGGTTLGILIPTTPSSHTQFIEIADKNKNPGKQWILKPDFYGFKSFLTLLGYYPEWKELLDIDIEAMMAYRSPYKNGDTEFIKTLLLGISSADEILEIANKKLGRQSQTRDITDRQDSQNENVVVDKSKGIKNEVQTSTIKKRGSILDILSRFKR